MRPLLFPVLLIALAAGVFAQDAGSPVKTSIAGTVTDALSGRPIAGCDVWVRRIRNSEWEFAHVPGQGDSSHTGADGKFQLNGLAPGRYLVRASREGYFMPRRVGTGSFSQIVILVPGQHIEDLVISLTPGGAIAGHIAGEDGKPVPDASLEVLKYSSDSGARQLSATTVRGTTSGEYRIDGLAPGKYYLRARSPHLQSTKAHGNLAYVPSYYPNAIDLNHAAVLEVRAGEELAGIDLNVSRVHTVSVSGNVVNAPTSFPASHAEVTLLSDDGNTVFSSDPTNTDAKGTFSFSSVPAGSYVIVAQGELIHPNDRASWGRASIQVGENNISAVRLLIGPGTDLHGSIRVEGNLPVDFNKLDGTLEPRAESAVAERMPDVDNAVINADGTFTFRDVPEGSYELSFLRLPPGTYLKSASSGDVASSNITIGPGHATPVLDLILSPALAQVTGTVSSYDGPFSGASVVLVPEGRRQNELRSFKFTISDKSGRFALRSVPPGDYQIFAWQDTDREALTDPAFLRVYQNLGRAVHVGSDGRVDVSVDVISGPGNGP